MFQGVKMNRRIKRITGLVILLFLLSGIAFGCYVGDYYRSVDVDKYLLSSEDVKVVEIEEGWLFDGTGTEDAVIFYPGAKVEVTAYAPLMHELAERGMDCFLVKMPCNLAFFGMGKAENIMGSYTYEHWFLAGHSLGGAMAGSWAAKHGGEIDGLILLGAYQASDISDASFPVLVVYGSEDRVLNREKLERGRELVPEDYTEVCIEGGNHALFGSYGEQAGDGAARISHEEQWKRTAEAVTEMIADRKDRQR